MREPMIPAAVLDEVRRDLRPVRPLPAPLVRALIVLPIGLALLAGLPLFWGVRRNIGELAPWASWGLSALESLAGLLIVGAALSEAVPGRRLSARAVTLTLGAGALIPVTLTLVTSWLLPAEESPGVRVRFAIECFDQIAMWAMPAVAVPAWLAARAWPERPAVAGACYGLGTGVMADAGARLFCWVSAPFHVLLSHGGAILAVTVCGACVATLIDRRRPRPTVGTRPRERRNDPLDPPASPTA